MELDQQFNLPEAEWKGTVPTLEHSCALAGIRVAALEPGDIDIHYGTDRYLLDINLNDVQSEAAFNSDKVQIIQVEKNSMAWFPPTSDFRIKVSNYMWGLLMEVEPGKAFDLAPELIGKQELLHELVPYAQNRQAAILGRLLIQHLRQPSIDPLYVEGLSLALFSTGLPFDQRCIPVSTVGTQSRIKQSIDYIEANFGCELSVAELAAVACMSPSYFSQCFKEVTSESVWAFVKRRRCERAHGMLLFTSELISTIAYKCGFSSQAHLTTMMKAKYGVTPAKIRKDKSGDFYLSKNR